MADDFVLCFEMPEPEHDGCKTWTVETTQGFVHAKHDKESTFKRKLASQLLDLLTGDADGV